MNSINKKSMSEAGRMGWEVSIKTNKKRWAEIRKKYEDNPDICKTCGQPLAYEKRGQTFCSHSCSASWCNSGVPRRVTDFKVYTCAFCGKEIISRLDKVVFCSMVCCADFKRAASARKIENGKFLTSHPSVTLRRYLYDKRGKICEVCHLSEWMGKPIPLNVHHIDGNAANNMPDNLKLLCLNCHGQTSTYSNRGNRKGTRNYRRKPAS